jgi:signal transduction histidine kinase
VFLSVTDSGPGIAAHERERVFEPFVRGAAADGDRGSGLGLAIARGFVALNGGRLWVDPSIAGGAEFVIALPAVSLPVDVTV